MNLLEYLKRELYFTFFMGQYSLKRIERSNIRECWRINSKRI
jgi:hypothetical protein